MGGTILSIRNPSFRDWEQFEFMRDLPCLEELVFLGNPLEEESSEEGVYTRKVNFSEFSKQTQS